MKWRIRDIIDFEYFFYRDTLSLSDADQQQLTERDRAIFIDSVLPQLKEDEKPKRHFLLHTWLKKRRAQAAADSAVLPGESFESLYGSFRLLFVLAGLFLGGGAGMTFLAYTGERTVNVFVYISVFVLSQLFLLLVLLGLSFIRLRRKKLSFSPLYRAVGRFMLKMVMLVRGRISEKMGAERRSRSASLLGLVISRGRTYGILLWLPVFILTQLFAIGFNLGLLITTLFKVITADIAFGWQSTLRLSSTAVHFLVQKIALPWSWLIGPDSSYPSLAQIEGSNIILKEGIYHLSTPDLASWWPFLCFSLLFYGLLPRLILLLGGAALQQGKLRRLDLRQGSYEQLLLRMTTPLLSTRGSGIDAFDKEPRGEAFQDEIPQKTAPVAANPDRNLLVLIPGDIIESVPEEDIIRKLKQRFNTVVAQIIRINEEFETDSSAMQQVKKIVEPGATDILLIQEAWQPPINEYINFIKNLRIAIGHGPCIRIGLTGKPGDKEIFTTPTEDNRKIWTRKINSLGDPCIYVAELANHDA